jgi:hypothetical protein
MELDLLPAVILCGTLAGLALLLFLVAIRLGRWSLWLAGYTLIAAAVAVALYLRLGPIDPAGGAESRTDDEGATVVSVDRAPAPLP